MRFLIDFLWETKCVGSARITGPSPTVWKGKVAAEANFAFTPWAKRAIDNDPNLPLWQFHIPAAESSRHHEAKGLILRHLAASIEEYALYLRPLLAASEKVQALFLNRSGQALRDQRLWAHVKRQTRQFGPRGISPSSIRLRFQDYWINHHEKDYLGLAHILGIELDSVRKRHDPTYHKTH